MTNPPLAETNPETGSRWYVHPLTGERFISVTTVLATIAKYGLPAWSAGLAADWAMDNAAWLADVVTEGPESCADPNDPDEACGCCRACARIIMATRHIVERDKAGSLGGRLHEAAEHHSLFGPGGAVDDDIQPYLGGYLRWLEEWKPDFDATEMTVISRKWGYAGTLDWIARFQAQHLPQKFKHLAGKNILGDTTTGKHLYLTKGWQVVAYANADAALMPDGSEQPLPAIGGGLVLHIHQDPKPDRHRMLVQLRTVQLTDANHHNFIHLLRVAEGLGAGLNSVLSRPFTLEEN